MTPATSPADIRPATYRSATADLAVAWILAVLLTALLGWLRLTTMAEYAFASAVVIPVFLVSWTGGFLHGAIAASLATLAWVASDIVLGLGARDIRLAVMNGATHLATYMLIAHLTGRLRTLLRREVELSTHDGLTGLLNRRAFVEEGAAAVRRAIRHGRSLAIIFLDLDHFKRLNDTRGHRVGDEALQLVGKLLRDTLRATDSVARIGGDEFAVLMPEIGEQDSVLAGHKVAARLEQALAAFSPVSASIGVAWFEHPRDDFAELIQAADALMYEVKKGGTGGVCARALRQQADPRDMRRHPGTVD